MLESIICCTVQVMYRVGTQNVAQEMEWQAALASGACSDIIQYLMWQHYASPPGRHSDQIEQVPGVSHVCMRKYIGDLVSTKCTHTAGHTRAVHPRICSSTWGRGNRGLALSLMSRGYIPRKEQSRIYLRVHRLPRVLSALQSFISVRQILHDYCT